MCDTTTPDNTNLEIPTGITPRMNRRHRRWSGGEWVARLREDPSLADQCDWAALDGDDWRRLLKACPQFADHCDWPKLDGKNWHRLLSSQPQFADKCDWSKLNAEDWRGLLISQPLFINKRSSLTLDDWCEWLCEHPRFIDHCPDGVWCRFGLGHWARLISTKGHAFAEKMMELGIAARISDWCCPDHWAEEYHTLFTVRFAAATHDEEVRNIAESSAINPNYEQVGGWRRVRYHDDMLKHIQWLASVAADCAQMAQQADESHAEHYALIAEAANYEIQMLTNLEIPTGITQKAFKDLRKYSKHSSWAIWREREPGKSSTDGINDLTIFDESNRPWEKLRPQFVFVGLNPANDEATVEQFSMFHSSRQGSKDYRLRYALHNTIFWGSYITDVLQTLIGAHSDIIMQEFHDACGQGRGHVLLADFLKELRNLTQILGRKPLLIAMGGSDNTLDVLKWAKDADLLNGYEITHIPHYSDVWHYGSKEAYRDKVWEKLGIRDVRTSQDCLPMAAPDMGSLHAGQSRRRRQATVANTCSTSGQEIKEQTTRGQNASPPSPLRRQYYDFWKSFQKWGRNNEKPWSEREPPRDGRPYFDTPRIRTNYGRLHLRFGIDTRTSRVSTEIYCDEGPRQRTSVVNDLQDAFNRAFSEISQDWTSTRNCIRFIRQTKWQDANDALFDQMAADYDTIREILENNEQTTRT